MQDNVILMTWPEESKAYQGFSQLNQLATDGAFGLEAAAVVQRDSDGRLSIRDSDDNVAGSGTIGGGAIGMIVGVLGGPLGMLLGFAGGALIGGAFDLDRDIDTSDALGELSRALPPGTTGLVAQVSEGSPAAIDQMAEQTGATVIRRPTDEVLGELAVAQDAADAAAAEARKRVREEKRSERKADFDDRINKLKEKLHL